MNWQEVYENRALHNLPYKIELNKQGQVIMSPTSTKLVFFQDEIMNHLQEQMVAGDIVFGFPVETSDGVKVTDVGWLTREQFSAAKNKISSVFSPMICVEILSPGSTPIEITYKKALYFEKGAEEVWLCDQDGLISFYDKSEQLQQSKLAPGFPANIAIDSKINYVT